MKIKHVISVLETGKLHALLAYFGILVGHKSNFNNNNGSFDF
jgi:hypothetical protein